MIQTIYHYNHTDDQLVVERVQDVAAIIEANKKAANDAPTGWAHSDFHHVASIPFVLVEKLKNEQGIDLLHDDAALKRFLNDPDNAFLRTKRGKI